MFFMHSIDAWRNRTLAKVFVPIIGAMGDRQNQIADRTRTCNRQCLRANYVTNRGDT